MPLLRVFLAAPLSTPEQRAFNEALACELEKWCRVFLPQRDVGLYADLLRRGMAVNEAQAAIFNGDAVGLRQCDIVVAVLESPRVTAGVCFELGMAASIGKVCVGLAAPRSALNGGDSSPILDAVLVAVLADTVALSRWLRSPSLNAELMNANSDLERAAD